MLISFETGAQLPAPLVVAFEQLRDAARQSQDSIELRVGCATIDELGLCDDVESRGERRLLQTTVTTGCRATVARVGICAPFRRHRATTIPTAAARSVACRRCADRDDGRKWRSNAIGRSARLAIGESAIADSTTVRSAVRGTICVTGRHTRNATTWTSFSRKLPFECRRRVMT